VEVEEYHRTWLGAPSRNGLLEDMEGVEPDTALILASMLEVVEEAAFKEAAKT